MSVLPKVQDTGIRLTGVDPALGQGCSDEKVTEDAAAQGRPRRIVARFLLLAAASAAMYLLFFYSCDRLLPLLTSCTLIGALVVMGLALGFCLVYGACAGYLLELLGIRELE